MKPFYESHPHLRITGQQIRITDGRKPHPSHCCQRCGDNIGWIGRFVLPFLHRCK